MADDDLLQAKMLSNAPSVSSLDSMEEEAGPIFPKVKINYNPQNQITHLRVCNNYLVMALANRKLIRIDLDVQSQDEVDITKNSEDLVHNLYLDPTGRHLLVAMQSGENFYVSKLPASNTKRTVRPIQKARGHIIDCVAWNRQSMTEQSSGPILIGTNGGLIFECELLANADVVYFRQVFSLSGLSISAIEFDELRGTSIGNANETYMFALFATPSRLYQAFCDVSAYTNSGGSAGSGGAGDSDAPSGRTGGGYWPSALSALFGSVPNLANTYTEMPRNLGYSDLRVFYASFRSVPTHFAWMTGAGVYFGRLEFKRADQVTLLRSFVTDAKLIEYSAFCNGVTDSQSTNRRPDAPATMSIPTAIALTEFHVVVLFADGFVRAVNVLNEQQSLNDRLGQAPGPAPGESAGRGASQSQLQPVRHLGLCSDSVKGLLWAHTERAVFKYRIVAEGRNVWQIFLEQGQFEAALRQARGHPSQTEIVLIRHADHLFANAKYEQSAQLYSQVKSESFEKIALKFLQLTDKQPLKVLLARKIAVYIDTAAATTSAPAGGAQQQLQLSMLVLWLIELHLNQLALLRESLRNVKMLGAAAASSSASLQTQSGGKGELEARLRNEQDELRGLLKKPRVRDAVKPIRAAVYELLSTHADQENTVFFAKLMGDHERVVEACLHERRFEEALQVLETQTKASGGVGAELFYRYAADLFEALPDKLITIWIQLGASLDPLRLVPPLAAQLARADSYSSTTPAATASARNRHALQLVRYLEFVVDELGDQQQAVHNYLLGLYAKSKASEKLAIYLERQGFDADQVCYDVKYALRVCTEMEQQQACVHLYIVLKLFEEAVETALNIDVECAKRCAQHAGHDEQLSRKLWLRIARHVVEKQKDMRAAMAILEECPQLRIEDVLVFFPDFATIDNFKEAICNSLAEYDKHIEQLKEEMSEVEQSTNEIRDEIRQFRNKFVVVKKNDACSLCQTALMIRGFYLFPCRHGYHVDCLVAEIRSHLAPDKLKRLDENVRKLNQKAGASWYSAVPGAGGTNAAVASANDAALVQDLRLQLDDIVAAECLFCGDLVIESIDKPLIDPHEYDTILNSWL